MFQRVFFATWSQAERIAHLLRTCFYDAATLAPALGEAAANGHSEVVGVPEGPRVEAVWPSPVPGLRIRTRGQNDVHTAAKTQKKSVRKCAKAAGVDSPGIAQVLLAGNLAKADPALVVEGQSALHRAIINGHEEVRSFFGSEECAEEAWVLILQSFALP